MATCMQSRSSTSGGAREGKGEARAGGNRKGKSKGKGNENIKIKSRGRCQSNRKRTRRGIPEGGGLTAMISLKFTESSGSSSFVTYNI